MSSRGKVKVKGKNKAIVKQEVIVEEREKQWYIPPSGGIPTYKAENDPNCPVGRIGHFNRKQKQKIQSIPDTNKTAEWIKQKLDRKYDDIPLKVHLNLSKKAIDEARGTYDTSVTRPSPAEVEILQKIIVRERLLGELTRLLRSGSDILSIMGEIVELIKAIRFETVDIVEDIRSWQAFQPTPRPFLYKGMNYLIKVSCDFDFLDNYDEVVERFCFEFKSNPFAYKGGGNIITGAGPKNSDRYLQGLLNSYYDGGKISVDGIEVVRLHNAEKIIQGEFNRLAEQGNINLGVSQSKLPDALQLMSQSIDVGGNGHTTGETELQKSMSSPALAGQSSSSAGKDNAGARQRPTSSSGRGKASSSIFSQKKIKLERIATLQSEVDELMAIISHISEKINTLSTDYRDRIKMYRAIESKMIDARNSGKEAAVQHCTAELVVRKAALLEISNKVKELQREQYFVGLEKKRKQGVIRTLHNELDEEKRKVSLKKKIEEVIKSKGLAAALDLINLEKEQQQQFMNKTGTNTSATSSSVRNPKDSSSLKKKKKGSKSRRSSNEAFIEKDEPSEFDPFSHTASSSQGLNFGETFSSQQMQQAQGLHVERIDEEDEEGEEREEDDEEEEDGEEDDEEDEEEDDEEDGEEDEEDGQYVASNNVDEGRIDRAGNVEAANNHGSHPSNSASAKSGSQPLSSGAKAAKSSLSKEDQLSLRHREELEYARQLDAELAVPIAFHDNPESALNHDPSQHGYISDDDQDNKEEENEGEDEDGDDLEVSADLSMAPAGSGFQVAKALKVSPRPTN